MAVASIGATLPANVPSPRYLSLREAGQLIAKLTGRPVNYSRLRAMWAEDHPAIMAMKRRARPKLATIHRIPEGAVIQAAGNWPANPVGRPHVPAALVLRILALDAEGRSSQAIAEQFTAEGLKTPTGRERWNPRTIYDIVQRERKGEDDGSDQHAHP